MDDEVKITARFDRSLISEGGDSIRYLLLELATPPRLANCQAAFSPLNLALVIDSSRSMFGERLCSAIQAASDIIEGLGDNDFISIVSFSETALVHVDGINCDSWGKQFALAALKSISVQAGTNLSEGWFKGAECVGTVMLNHANCKNHVLILSDGHANQGTLEPIALLHHAGELQSRGVTASAVGVGEGYSTAQLYAIAQHGGGRIHHATHPPEIVEVVMGELTELRERIIENLMVTIKFPPSLSLKSLNIIPCEMQDNSVRCVFGGMTSGTTRSAVFRVSTTAGRKKQQLKIELTANWRQSGQSEPVQRISCVANLTYADPGKNAVQVVDEAAAFWIARFWQSWIVWQVTNLNRLRDYNRLERLLTRETKFFRRFCQVIPTARALLAELDGLSRIVYQDWDESSRKEIQTSTYTTSYNLKDSRSGSRKWQDFTGQFKTR